MVEQQTPSCRRTSEREEVVLAGSAFGLGRSRSIIVSDQGLRSHRPFDDVLVVVGPFDGLATVVWRSDDKCGVHFDEALAAETLDRMKTEAKWMSVAGWYR